MIKIKNLCKSYSDLVVFDNFNLNIKKGKITCIVGESGSGKTTLLNVLANLTDYTGEVDRVECSYVFQKPNLFPNMTVKKNLELVCKDQEKINAVANELFISEKLNSYPNHLSGGQAQRVALARAILFDKELLLLDEPFSNLDVGLRFSLLEKIKRLHSEKGNTILMVTHDVKEAVSVADRVVVLKDGEIIFDCESVTKKTEEQIFSLLIQGFALDKTYKG